MKEQFPAAGRRWIDGRRAERFYSAPDLCKLRTRIVSRRAAAAQAPAAITSDLPWHASCIPGQETGSDQQGFMHRFTFTATAVSSTTGTPVVHAIRPCRNHAPFVFVGPGTLRAEPTTHP